jgi:hypothetical protein
MDDIQQVAERTTAAVLAQLNAEIGASGLTVKALALAMNHDYGTVRRYFVGEKQLPIKILWAALAVLDVQVDVFMARAMERLERNASALALDQGDELIHRIGILTDVYEIEHGSPLSFVEIAAQLHERGIPMSRARWARLAAEGSYGANDKALMSAIADIFGEAPEYLTNLGKPSESQRIARHMPAVSAKRQAQLLGVAARTLGPIAPETYSAIARTLMRDIEQINLKSRGDDG